MQYNDRTNILELDCITCKHINNKICNCMIFSGNPTLPNLYQRQE